ncbi:MAG: hypothetical protein Q7S92_05320 [Candidatus Diapherotrites archaeon]|nr:hypothetical protein [Candidatus Diapherotrites archaeon]
MSFLKSLDKFLAGQSSLSWGRKKALDDFRKKALLALERLQKTAKSNLDKQLFAQMAYNIKTVPLMFYHRKALRVNPWEGSVTQGEHVRSFDLLQKGSQKFVIKKDYINLPAEHVFYNDNLSLNGIFTLCHEYGHFPKPLLLLFAAKNGLSEEQGEELLADILSAKLSIAMGFPLERIMSHFSGREIVYGYFPFRQYILESLKL